MNTTGIDGIDEPLVSIFSSTGQVEPLFGAYVNGSLIIVDLTVTDKIVYTDTSTGIVVEFDGTTLRLFDGACSEEVIVSTSEANLLQKRHQSTDLPRRQNPEIPNIPFEVDFNFFDQCGNPSTMVTNPTITCGVGDCSVVNLGLGSWRGLCAFPDIKNQEMDCEIQANNALNELTNSPLWSMNNWKDTLLLFEKIAVRLPLTQAIIGFLSGGKISLGMMVLSAVQLALTDKGTAPTVFHAFCTARWYTLSMPCTLQQPPETIELADISSNPTSAISGSFTINDPSVPACPKNILLNPDFEGPTAMGLAPYDPWYFTGTNFGNYITGGCQSGNNCM